MGYVEILQNGLIARLENGELRSVTRSAWCDKCNSLQSAIGGKGVEILNDTDRQVVLWICSKCRKL
jgi:hypothetical protein